MEPWALGARRVAIPRVVLMPTVQKAKLRKAHFLERICWINEQMASSPLASKDYAVPLTSLWLSLSSYRAGISCIGVCILKIPLKSNNNSSGSGTLACHKRPPSRLNFGGAPRARARGRGGGGRGGEGY